MISRIKSSCSKYRRSVAGIGESERVFYSAKNAHVGVQWLIQLPKGACVGAPVVAGSDFPAEIYYEGFTKVTRLSSESGLFVPDDYPDVLIPFSQPVEAEADGWFIVYFDFYVPVSAEAGAHRAEVEIRAGNRTLREQFEIFVYGCSVSGINRLRSCFLLRDKDIEWGEGKFDRDLKRVYFERIMDFRVNSFVLPVDSEYTAEQIAEEADRYFDHPMFTSFALQNDTAGVTSARTDTYADQIYALAKRSRPGRNLLTKAYTYFYDEADESGKTASALKRVKNYQNELEKAAAFIENSQTHEFDVFKSIPNWRESIVSLPCIGTVHPTSKCAELLDRTGIWCPAFGRLEDKHIREKFRHLAETAGKELWWYGCMGPRYPHPTYHIDDFLLSSRILGWMQCAYGVHGLLYWDAAGYKPGSPVGKPDAEDWDVYTSPYKGSNLPAGDGFLFYPGRKYGVNGPLPSLRLMSIRDGLEDYELLLDAVKIAEKRGDDLSLLYGDLFENVMYDADEARFLERHRNLLAYLESGALPERKKSEADYLEGDTEKLPESVKTQPEGKIWISRNGVGYGRAFEIYTQPTDDDRWMEISVALSDFLPLRSATRLKFSVKNFESRSLTLFIYLESGGESFLCQARELFENTEITVDIPYDRCVAAGSEKVVLKLRVRNTYRKEEKYSVRLAVNRFSIT